jgi:hypothetical protein
MSNIVLKTSDYTKSRLDRIQLVLNLYNYFTKDLNYTEVIEIEDHKGDLIILWEEKPTLEDKLLFKEIWEFLGEINVSHKYYDIVEDN